MSGKTTEQLALSVLSADTEEDVIALLTSAGYWDDPDAWRLFGDTESNFSTIGNQQSRPEAALVEKLVNSVDARLMAECQKRGIDPKSPGAPQTIYEAVASFFEPNGQNSQLGGRIANWPADRQREQARFITMAVTGAKPRTGRASITIVDAGEGQAPSRVPDTFLSIDRQNKLRIPFVQGKFNMGGTGALKFCGDHNLQLLITRRDPDVARAMGEVDGESESWTFTVVRRERPRAAGGVRNSVYRYLAPTRVHGSERRPLVFQAQSLKVLPHQSRPYENPLLAGSVIKLYEYDMKGFGSHALMKGGLLSRLELLLPGIALPVRVHECRLYRGDEGRSFENSLVGLLARLEEDRAGNLEDGYPTSVQLRVRGEEMNAQIFAFREDKAESYAPTDGIVFVVNGQTHGTLPRTFFERRAVRMQRIASSLLVVVDCSSLSVGAREDLFMNSRDRLSNGELRKAIEEELEDVIGKHPGLQALQAQRRSEEISKRLADSKPLEDVLGSILKSSPTLSQLFLRGQRLSKPYSLGAGESGNSGAGEGNHSFVGRRHPTYFRFHGKAAGAVLERSAEVGRRCRIKFDTDVENEYLSRPEPRGHYAIDILDGPVETTELDHSLTLHNGGANWNLNIRDEALGSGDEITVAFTITDDTLVEPFVNIATIRVADRSPDRSGGNGKTHTQRGRDDGRGANGGAEGGGLAMPNIVEVEREDEHWQRYHFDESDACQVIEEAGTEASERSFTFYVNVDNRSLQTELKGNSDAARVTRSKFVYGCVLVGLAMIHDERRSGRAAADGADEQQPSTTRKVRDVSRALSPFLIPMINSLGALTEDEVSALARQGDES